MNELLRACAARRYALLFYSLLATLGATPLLVALRLEASLLEFLLALNLLASVLGLEVGGARRALLILAVTGLLIHFTTTPAGGETRPAALAFWTAIAFVSAAFAARFAMLEFGTAADGSGAMVYRKPGFTRADAAKYTRSISTSSRRSASC